MLSSCRVVCKIGPGAHARRDLLILNNKGYIVESRAEQTGRERTCTIQTKHLWWGNSRPVSQPKPAGPVFGHDPCGSSAHSASLSPIRVYFITSPRVMELVGIAPSIGPHHGQLESSVRKRTALALRWPCECKHMAASLIRNGIPPQTHSRTIG